METALSEKSCHCLTAIFAPERYRKHDNGYERDVLALSIPLSPHE